MSNPADCPICHATLAGELVERGRGACPQCHTPLARDVEGGWGLDPAIVGSANRADLGLVYMLVGFVLCCALGLGLLFVLYITLE